MIPHFVSSLIVHKKVFHLYADNMFYEDIKESGASFIFYYMGQDDIGQVVIWNRTSWASDKSDKTNRTRQIGLESDKLGWDKLTWGKMKCSLQYISFY